jgi:O-antigen/teichoic acid export membrane protein
MKTQSPNNLSLTARTFWLIFAKTLAFVFGFALPLLLVRRLSQTDFGLYKQAFLVVGTGLGNFAARFCNQRVLFPAARARKRRRDRPEYHSPSTALSAV